MSIVQENVEVVEEPVFVEARGNNRLRDRYRASRSELLGRETTNNTLPTRHTTTRNQSKTTSSTTSSITKSMLFSGIMRYFPLAWILNFVFDTLKRFLFAISNVYKYVDIPFFSDIYVIYALLWKYKLVFDPLLNRFFVEHETEKGSRVRYSFLTKSLDKEYYPQISSVSTANSNDNDDDDIPHNHPNVEGTPQKEPKYEKLSFTNGTSFLSPASLSSYKHHENEISGLRFHVATKNLFMILTLLCVITTSLFNYMSSVFFCCAIIAFSEIFNGRYFRKLTLLWFQFIGVSEHNIIGDIFVSSNASMKPFYHEKTSEFNLWRCKFSFKQLALMTLMRIGSCIFLILQHPLPTFMFCSIRLIISCMSAIHGSSALYETMKVLQIGGSTNKHIHQDLLFVLVGVAFLVNCIGSLYLYFDEHSINHSSTKSKKLPFSLKRVFQDVGLVFLSLGKHLYGVAANTLSDFKLLISSPYNTIYMRCYNNTIGVSREGWLFCSNSCSPLPSKHLNSMLPSHKNVISEFGARVDLWSETGELIGMPSTTPPISEIMLVEEQLIEGEFVNPPPFEQPPLPPQPPIQEPFFANIEFEWGTTLNPVEARNVEVKSRERTQAQRRNNPQYFSGLKYYASFDDFAKFNFPIYQNIFSYNLFKYYCFGHSQFEIHDNKHNVFHTGELYVFARKQRIDVYLDVVQDALQLICVSIACYYFSTFLFFGFSFEFMVVPILINFSANLVAYKSTTSSPFTYFITSMLKLTQDSDFSLKSFRKKLLGPMTENLKPDLYTLVTVSCGSLIILCVYWMMFMALCIVLFVIIRVMIPMSIFQSFAFHACTLTMPPLDFTTIASTIGVLSTSYIMNASRVDSMRTFAYDMLRIKENPDDEEVKTIDRTIQEQITNLPILCAIATSNVNKYLYS